jgi:hypothetical protein
MTIHRVKGHSTLNVALHFTYRNIFSHYEKKASRLYEVLGALIVATLNPVKMIIN